MAETKTREEILLQLQKLQKMVESPNRNEAENAMALAHRLMLKHNIEQSEIDKAKAESEENKEQKVVEHYTNNHYEWTWFESHLARVLAKSFRCYYYISWAHYKDWYESKIDRHKAVFVGLEDDAKMAAELFDFAQQVAMYLVDGYVFNLKKNLVKTVKTKAGEKGTRHDWMTGFVDGIEQKFMQQIKEEFKLLAQHKLLALPAGTKKIQVSDSESESGYKYILIRDLRNHTPDQFLEDDDDIWKEEEDVEVSDDVIKETALAIADPVKDYYKELSKGFTSHKMSSSQSQRRLGNAGAYNSGQRAGKNLQKPSGQLN